MTAISRGEENVINNINWFTTVNDVLTDMYAIEYHIRDINDSLPGTQIFPTSGWEDVTSAPGNFDTGCYYAYDNTNGSGWTPEFDADLGSYRIVWRWKRTSTSDWQEGAEDFVILGVESASSLQYITLADVRAAGLEDTIYSDDTINAAIVLWQQVLERACRQWFYPRTLDLYLDGNNSDTLHLGIPIVTITSLMINGSDTELDSSLYSVYNSRTYPDDRRNPRIKLVHSMQLSDIYTAYNSCGELRFNKGYRNQRVQGTFGFTESDGTVPQAIQRALLKLVIEKLTRPLYTPIGEVPTQPSSITVAGIVIEEKTDGHSIKYANGGIEQRRSGLTGITNDPEILDIIILYRAPIGISMPSHWSY